MIPTYSPCGLDCSTCDAYLATMNNDMEMKTFLAKQAKEQHGMVINAEEINCVGCMNEGCHISYCDQCQIRVCVINRKIENCAYCPDYPCKIVSSFHEFVPKAKANIEQVRANL